MSIFVVNRSMRLRFVPSLLILIILLFGNGYFGANKLFAQTTVITQRYNTHQTLGIDTQQSNLSIDLAKKEVTDAVLEEQLMGRPASQVDSFKQVSDTLYAFLFQGPVLEWSKIGRGNIPNDLLHELRFPKDSFEGRTVRPSTYVKLIEEILIFYEERGYPFVSVRLDSLTESGSKVSAQFFLDKGKRIVMDTLDIRGDANLRKSFLYSYLGFKPGDPYQESTIQSLDKQLRKLPFINVKSQSRVYFLHDKAHVVLDLKKRKTDRIDGIVGFAPNSEQSDNQDLLLTGEINIDLNNLMGSAKAFDLKWKSFGERSQELKLGANLPYLFQLPFGIDGFAEFYKYDTLTINVKSGLGVQYLFQGTNYLRFYYENSLSILQTIDTATIRLSKRIPTTNPVSLRSYGIDFLLEQVDYNFNPRKGFKLKTKLGLGNKIIERDARIQNVLFTNSDGDQYSVYDSLELKIFTGRAEYSLTYFQPLGSKSVLVPMIQGKHTISDQIFFDELFRIGGNGDLRGFDERSIQASSYHIYQLEYRYIIGQNSYFSTFFNGAYYQNFSEGNRNSDRPFGFGVGLNLEVKTGILQLAYALGKEQGNPIQFNQSKIHFGIVSFI